MSPQMALMTAAALEQTAALVEGKVTPRLSGLLDSIKDEKKVSLAVADPKLGTSLHYDHLHGLKTNLRSQCHQQIATALFKSHLRLDDAGPLPSHP